MVDGIIQPLWYEGLCFLRGLQTLHWIRLQVILPLTLMKLNIFNHKLVYTVEKVTMTVTE